MTNKQERAMTRARGFSLIELMIVVAIIAIIAAFAIPAYGRYAYRAHRADGQGLLLNIATAEERYYSTFNKYGSLTDIGYSASPVASDKQYYSGTVSIPAGSSSQSFVATATPVGAQVGDDAWCGALTLNNAGVKTPGPASAASNANGSCW